MYILYTISIYIKAFAISYDHPHNNFPPNLLTGAERPV